MSNPKDAPEQMEHEDDHRKLSLSYEIGGEKFRLIDVSKEDDFLIDSPLFDSLEDLRLSVSFDSTNVHEAIKFLGSQSSQEGNKTEEIILQNEKNLSSSCAMEVGRPSYLRKSLAWNSAFLDSAGVLDPDELTFINRGLKAVEDIRMRRAERKSTVNGSRKIDIGHQNKRKTNTASQRHRIQRSEKTKIEHYRRREKASLKPPKAFQGMENLLRGQRISASLNAYDAAIKNKSATRLGKDMMLCKNSGLVNSCTHSSGCLSSPTFSSVFSISTSDSTVSWSPHDASLSGSSRKIPSALVKCKTESRKSKLCTSTSTSESPPKALKKSKELGHPRLSTLSMSISNNTTCISPASSSNVSYSKSTSRSKQQSDELEAHLDAFVPWRPGLQSDVLQGPNTPNILQRKSSFSLQFEEINSPAQMNTEAPVGSCSIPTEPRKKFKPSGLRQPSPTIGFFDEEETMSAKAYGGLQFRCEMESTSPYEYRPINRKRPAKLLPDKTSPKTNTSKHPQGSYLLHSAPGIKGRNASSDKKLWNSSPRVSSTVKSLSDVAFRRHTPKCLRKEEEVCFRSSTARECDKKKFGHACGLEGEDDQRQVKGRLNKRSGIQNKGQRADKKIQGEQRNHLMKEKNATQQTVVDDLHLQSEERTISPTNWEDQVNALSTFFEFIDLGKDALTEFKGNKDPACSENMHSNTENRVDFDREITLDNELGDLPSISPNPSQSSLSLTDILPSSRTPLADKTSICNQTGSFKSSGESTKGRLEAKASAVSSFEGIDKENI